MIGVHRRLSTFLVVGLFAGCGGATPPPKTGAEEPAETTQPQTAEAEQPDLSPVEAPDDLIAVGRLKDPGHVVDTVADWISLPVDWRRMLAQEEPGIESVILFDAPVEAAVALDPTGPGKMPQPFMVVSIGLSSLDGALAFARDHGQSVRQIQTGVYRVEGEDLANSCAIAAAIGPAPARLVCGDRPVDVDALLPYATRGLPLVSLGDADLHIELRAEPLRRRYARDLRQLKTVGPSLALRELRLDAPRFDRAMADTVHALVDEALALSEDVDRLAVDITAHREKREVDARFGIRFRTKQSWSVGLLADSASRAQTAPDSFWLLPADAQLASYSASVDDKRFAPIRRTLAQLLEGWLTHENVPRRARSQLVDLVERAWAGEVASVYARGAVEPADTSKMSRSQRAAEALRQSVGWHLMGIEEKPDRLRKMLDQLASVYQDAQLRQTLKKELDIDPRELPPLKVRPAVGKGLAPGARRYELVLTSEMLEELAPPDYDSPMKRGRPAKVSVVLVLMPDGERTWLAVSTDAAVAIARLAEVRAGKSARLSSRSGLGRLRTQKSVSAGFFSLAAAFSTGGSVWSEMGASEELARATTSMPHHGETPILYRLGVTDAEGVEASWSVTVPKAVFEDVAAVAPMLADQGGRALGPGGMLP